MANDAEAQLYEDMADLKEQVPKLQNEIKKVKANVSKLTRRVDSSELMGFQEQITKLNERLGFIDEKLLGLSQIVAITEIERLNLHMQDSINAMLSTGVGNRQQYTRLREALTFECSKARTEASTSPTPTKILTGFRVLCMDCSRKYNLDAFMGKP
ncbi:MAG: hypothetical protein V1894_06020 [Chloroflexota bacterium]